MLSLIQNKLFHRITLSLIGAILVLAIWKNSSLEIAYALCALLFWIQEVRLSSLLAKEQSVQEAACKTIGYALVPPSLGVIGIGILCIFQTYLPVILVGGYVTVGLSALLSVCLLLQLMAAWKKDGIAKRFMKLVIAASLSVPMSLAIVLMLHIRSADEGGVLSAMTTILFGATALLIAIDMILVSACGYKSTIESIHIVRDVYRQHALMVTRASILKDGVLVVAKSVLSIIGASFFMFVNALFSVGMGAARFIAVKMHSQEREQQIQSYRSVGIIVSIAGICYVLYSIRLLFGGSSGVYDINIALAIALYTFVEFGINIRESIRLRNSRELEAKALRAISFSATLICFVLTQTAIMSFANEGDSSVANALSGIFFGSLAATRGLFVFIDSLRQKDMSIESLHNSLMETKDI